MLSNIEEIELNKLVEDKIELGDQLQKRFEPFIHIEGAIKIQKKISRELKYLEKVCSALRAKICECAITSWNVLVCLGQMFRKNSIQQCAV